MTDTTEAEVAEVQEAPAPEAEAPEAPAIETPEADETDEAPVEGSDDFGFLLEDPEGPLDADEPEAEGVEEPAQIPDEEGEKPAVEEAPEEVPAVEEKPAEAEAPPAEAKPAAEATPAKPPEVEKPAPADQPQPEVQETPQITAEEYREYFGQVRDTAIDKLATEYFALDEETVETLRIEPEKALPKLAAQVYFDAVTQAVTAVYQQLPAAIDAHMGTRQVSSESEVAFFDEWPALKGADQGAIVRIGQAYRQANPQASAEDFIRDVGASAHVALGLPLEPEVAEVETPAAEESQPFRPAGTSRPAAPASKPANAFTQLDEELFADDDGLDADT